jgi:hypothetical protein
VPHCIPILEFHHTFVSVCLAVWRQASSVALMAGSGAAGSTMRRISGRAQTLVYSGRAGAVHRPSELLQPALEELLHAALEDYKVDITIGEGPSAAVVASENSCNRAARCIRGVLHQLTLVV